MGLDEFAQGKEFLDGISISVRNIICSSFPQATAPEREDIEQEVKLKIWRMASRGKKVGNFRSYLWRVVYATTLDVLGERMNASSFKEWFSEDRQDLLQKLDLLSPEVLVEKKELNAMLLKVLDSLPQKRRVVIRLYIADMRLNEIADFLGWSQDKVVHLFYRGLEDLKRAVRRRTDHHGLGVLDFKKKPAL